MSIYTEPTKQLLRSLVFLGAITIPATTGKIFVELAEIICGEDDKLRSMVEKWRLARLIARLNKNKVVIVGWGNDGCTVRLTEKGQRIYRKMNFEDLEIPIPPSWDGKFRIVIFDIPEKRMRRARDIFRDKLDKLGFIKLQKSVWVLPWHCEKEILFAAEYLGISRYVNIVTAERVFNDIDLRKKFGLLLE